MTSILRSRRLRWLSWMWIAPASLLILGCGPEKGDITGKVTFNGEMLPVGRISFLSEVGKKPVLTAYIVRGKYSIKGCPAGPVKISIESFRPPKSKPLGGKRDVPPRREEVVKDFPVPQPPPELAELMAGEQLSYLPIPPRYGNSETSGLTYTVQPGVQTHDIPLGP